MVKENAVLQLGVKGADLVVSTFKKINKQKDQFSKAAKLALGAAGKFAFAKGGAAADDAAISKRRQEETRATRATRAAGEAMLNVAQAASTLNPTELIRSVAASGFGLAAGIAQGVGNAAWGGVGDVAKSLIEYSGKLTDIAINAASGAVQAAKGALPIAVEQEARRSMLMAGGSGMNAAINTDTMSRANAASLSQALIPVVGKIEQNSRMARQLTRLFETRNGQIVNREQAMSIAQGNFSVLGTDKGWFVNQLSSQFNGLPPSIAQELRAQLMEFTAGEEQKEGASFRQKQVNMEASDLAAATKIASMDLTAVAEANKNLNELSVQMVGSAKQLNVALAGAAKGLGDFLGSINKRIEEANAEAAKKAKR